jgi:voltage-gated potassium channel
VPAAPGATGPTGAPPKGARPRAPGGSARPRESQRLGFLLYGALYTPLVFLRAAYRQLAILVVMTLAGGAIFSYYEGLAPIPAVLAAVSTITTIGLFVPNGGNFHTINQGEAVLLILLIIVSVGSAVSLLQATVGTFMNGDLTKDKAAQRLIERLKHHVIVFGYGAVGKYVVETLQGLDLDFVVVTTDPQHYADLLKNNTLVILQQENKPLDALKQAGIERAGTLIVSHETDPHNMMITLSARRLRPDIRVVSVVHDTDLMDASQSAGADMVIPSSATVGHLLALSATTQNLVGIVVSQELGEKEIVRFVLSESSAILGKGLHEVSRHATIISVVRGGSPVPNLFDPSLRLQKGDTLLVLADHESLRELESRRGSK